MTNYVITKYNSTDESIENVVTNMETHLETRDSTNNPIFCIDIVNQGVNKFTGIVVTKGA